MGVGEILCGYCYDLLGTRSGLKLALKPNSSDSYLSPSEILL